jgi:hypothetical protein
LNGIKQRFTLSLKAVVQNHTKFWEKNQKILGKTTIFFRANIIFLGSATSSLKAGEHKALKDRKNLLRLEWEKPHRFLWKSTIFFEGMVLETAIRQVYIRFIIPHGAEEPGKPKTGIIKRVGC